MPTDHKKIHSQADMHAHRNARTRTQSARIHAYMDDHTRTHVHISRTKATIMFKSFHERTKTNRKSPAILRTMVTRSKTKSWTNPVACRTCRPSTNKNTSASTQARTQERAHVHLMHAHTRALARPHWHTRPHTTNKSHCYV